MSLRMFRLSAMVLFGFGAALHAQAVPAAAGDSLTVARIFSNEFSARGVGQLRWIEGGTAFITVDRAATGRGREIVRHETATDAKRVLVALEPTETRIWRVASPKFARSHAIRVTPAAMKSGARISALY